jgi:hypothetical protein
MLLEKDFALKALGDVHYFLGIEVKRSRDGLVLSQGRYAREVIERVSMTSCKSIASPMVLSEKLSFT